MIRAWNRYCVIVTDRYKFDLNNIDFEFDVSKKEQDKPMEANITIYNLNKMVRDSFEPSSPIVIYAGYEEKFGIIFQGVIGACYSNKIGEDIKTTIIATEDTVKWNTSQVHASWGRYVSAELVITDAIKKGGFDVGYINMPKDNPRFERGVAYRGDLRNFLQYMATDMGCEYNIDGGKVDFYVKDDVDSKRVITVSPESGLINAHERIDSNNSKSSSSTIPVAKIAEGENVPIGQQERVSEQWNMQTQTESLPLAERSGSSTNLDKYKQSWDLELVLNHEYKVGYGIRVVNSDWINDSVFKIKEYTHTLRGDTFQTNMKVEEVIQ